MKNVLIAGGLCGMTMLRAAEKIKEVGMKKDIDIEVTIHDLWASSYVNLERDLVIEMFPYFEDLDCPLLSGKPFIHRRGEDELVNEIIRLLEVEA